MPSTIRIKRSSVAGKRPTTTDISTGELALNTKDFKLFSSNGTAIFELANAPALANTNSRIGLLNTNLTGTNTALRTLINARLQVANASAIYAPKASPTFTGSISAPIVTVTQSLANEGGQIDFALPSSGSTLSSGVSIDIYQNRLRIFESGGTNRGAYIDLSAASTGVGSNLLAGGSSTTQYLQVTNANATFATKAYAAANTYVKSILANTNAYIASRASWTALTGTNTALRTLISDRLQVANAVATYQTKAVERAALANTNASIATQATRVTLVNTNLTGTNTALRTLINARLQVSNAATLYATKSNPATSGLLAHTGRATISTNLAVTGNTTIAGLVANGSLGTANKFLKTNGTTTFWGDATPVVLTKKNVSALLETDQVVTNVTAVTYANTVVDNSLLSLYAPRNSPTFTGTIDDSQAATRSQTLTDGATIAWNTTLGTVATVTLGGNRTISNPTNLRVGTYMLIVKQDATGSRTLTWGTAYKFPAGVKPTLTTTANAIDIISFFCDGTNMFGTYAPNMS